MQGSIEKAFHFISISIEKSINDEEVFIGSNNATGRIPRTDVTVSGLSSGASMAIQLHIAFSNEISACGILAGPPYYCAGNLMTASLCMSGPLTSISVPTILSKIKSYESLSMIDPRSNIQNDSVYIFTGKYDTVALPGIVKLNEQIYRSLGARIRSNYDMSATHGFPTENYGLNCLILNLNSYINNCQFNMAFDMLNHLYGGNLIRPRSDRETELLGQFVQFDQDSFMNPPRELNEDQAMGSSLINWLSKSISLYSEKKWPWPSSGLANWTIIPSTRDSTTSRSLLSSFDKQGFIYFARSCAQGKRQCSIHVALHGCQQGCSVLIS